MTVLRKDPTEIKTFGVNWAAYLPTGVTITASEWDLPAGVTEVDSDFTTTATTVQLSSGTDLIDYEPLNRVTLSNGDSAERIAVIQVREASWRLIEDEILQLAEIMIETPSRTASLIENVTVNQVSYLRTELALWAPIRDSHVKLKGGSDGVDFDNERKRDAIRRRVRRSLGLSAGWVMAGVFAGGISKADNATRNADTDRVSPMFTTTLHQSE